MKMEGRGRRRKRAGQEKEPEIPAKNDQSICTSSTPKSVHQRATSAKDGGAREEEPARAFQVHPKMGRTLHHQYSS